PYIADMCAEAPLSQPTPAERKLPSRLAQNYLSPPLPQANHQSGDRPQRVLSVFPAAGQAAFRTHCGDSARDLSLLFRSSPFGSISHSHANNNDFILHVGGK